MQNEVTSDKKSLLRAVVSTNSCQTVPGLSSGLACVHWHLIHGNLHLSRICSHVALYENYSMDVFITYRYSYSWPLQRLDFRFNRLYSNSSNEHLREKNVSFTKQITRVHIPFNPLIFLLQPCLKGFWVQSWIITPVWMVFQTRGRVLGTRVMR